MPRQTTAVRRISEATPVPRVAYQSARGPAECGDEIHELPETATGGACVTTGGGGGGGAG